MKHWLVLITLITYSHYSFAQSVDSEVETELSWGQTEEAKAEAQEQAKFLEREKIRKTQMKQQALKSAEEAKKMEAAAVQQVQITVREKERLTAEVKEYQRQIKINEERKAKAQKDIQLSKDEADRYRRIAQEYKVQRDSSQRELERLNKESANIAKWTQEAKMKALNAKKDAAYAAAQTKQKEAANEKALQSGNRIYRGISSER
ncbi:MAG: hypothetical protein ACM3MG_03110 [Bacillota bacterium]